MTITIKEVSAYTIGALIALFERAVGFYATLVSINAYDQPGVEAGKKAATEALNLRAALKTTINDSASGLTIDEICKTLSVSPDVAFSILDRLVTNGEIRRDGERISPTSRYKK